ncbi:MAG: hypothetical protein HFH27_12010 [Clostridiaceae bacterium]|nr:hypothetical protein [Clostridiaceae bacterium]
MAASKAVLSTQAAVIGALLIHPEICGELFAETSARDLVTADYRDVYEAARALLLEDKPADPVTVLDRMGGGPETRKFLLEMMDITPSAANWREYAKLLREQARLYRLQQAGKRLMRSGTLDEARSVLSDAQQDGSDMEGGNVVSISQGTVDFLKRQSEPVRYINFGVGRLDRQLYASLGDFIVIGGRPSAGKTLFSVQLADTLSRKYRVGYFSLETSPEKIFDRFFAQAVPLDFSDVKRHSLSREDYEALTYQKRRFLEQHLDVIRAGGYTAEAIQMETLRRRYQVILVDYLQLVRLEKSRAGNRTEEVGAVSRALHTLAQRHNVLVIALAQLSRAPKGMRVDPTLSDLRESGQIEQDADIVMLLSLKIPDTDDEDNGDRLLQIVKNKEGRTGKFCLAFDGRHQQLVERMGGQEK